MHSQKAMTQFRLQVNGILNLFNLYGLGVYLPEVASQIETLALQLHQRLNGEDMPIYVTPIDKR